MILFAQLIGAIYGLAIFGAIFKPNDFDWDAKPSQIKIGITISLALGALSGGQIYLGFK